MTTEPDASQPVPRRGHAYRHAAATARVSRDLVFDRLPLAVRDRLTRGIVHGALPDPVLAAPSGRAPLALRALIAAGTTAGVATIGVWFRDFGEPRGPYAMQPTYFAALYGAFFLVAVVATAAVVHLRRFQRGAPFRSGRYLFPLDLVEASGGKLRVTSLDQRCRVEARSRAVALVFEDGHEVTFPVAKRDDAGEIAARVQGVIDAARELVYPADEVKLERIDPFFETRVSDDWAAAADAPGARPHTKLAWIAAGAAAAAAPAGLGMLRAHNALSDDAMFLEATTQRPGEKRGYKLAAYASRGVRHQDEIGKFLVEEAAGDRTLLRRYLARGGRLAELADDALFELAKQDLEELSEYLQRGSGRHRDEADDALFAIAQRVRTVRGYSVYLEAGKRHADEVRKDLLPDADFAQASKSDLVGALFSFVRRNPGSKHEDEAWRRIRAVYAEALPAFRAAERAPAGGRFAEALLAALQERADPRVDIQITMIPPATVAEADAVLGAKHGARYLPAAHRFRASSLNDLSEIIHSSVAAWFGRSFPHGVAEITRSSGEEGRPVIEIRCEPVAYGSSQWRSPLATSADPAYVTPLVGFAIEVRGRVPGHDGKDETVTWKAQIEDKSSGKMLATDSRGQRRSTEDLIEDAFAKFLAGVPEQIAESFHQKL